MKKKTTYFRPRLTCVPIQAGLLLAGSGPYSVTMEAEYGPQDDVSAAKDESFMDDESEKW